ncbi:MAG: hypothetical protein ACFCUV_00360 [Rivularia sp. (in: cyanobacteria)]
MCIYYRLAIALDIEKVEESDRVFQNTHHRTLIPRMSDRLCCSKWR